MSKHIYGAGGGGGGGNQTSKNDYEPYEPTYTDDDPALKSTSWAQLQFLVSEGEIQGPRWGNNIEGLEQSLYLDQTAIRASGFAADPKPTDLVLSYGRPRGSQSGVPGFNGPSNVTSVDKLVKFNGPVIQTISDTSGSNIYARVIVTFQGLVRTTNKGDILGTSVEYKVTCSDINGNITEVFNDTITGKFSSSFQRQHEWKLTGSAPWTIQVERLTRDDEDRNDSSNTYRSMFNFSSVVTTIDQSLIYPNSSVLSIGLRADRYRSIPEVALHIYGTKVQVPTTYNPSTRTYSSSTWDGSFKTEYTDNPAWVFYDICTNDRYGLGEYIEPELIDKWTLYEIGKYCDELVPADGEGKTEPRFVISLALQTSAEAWDVLQQLSSIFRGLLYYANGAIACAQDKDQLPVYAFNQANTISSRNNEKVEQGNFTYSGTSKRSRHTVVLVSYDDPDDFFNPRVEYVADEEGIARFGYKALDLRLMGVTSRSQALRAANWALLSEKLLTDTVAFSCNEIGLALRPGDVIKVTDPYKQTKRMGGRFLGVDSVRKVLTLDQAPAQEGGTWSGSTISWMSANTNGDPVLVNKNIADISGDELTVASGTYPSTPPQVGWPYIIETPDTKARQYRIVSVVEAGEGTFDIIATEYDPAIFSQVDVLTPISTPTPAPVQNDMNPPTITRAEYQFDQVLKIDLAWDPPIDPKVDGQFDPRVEAYRVQWRRGGKQGDEYVWNKKWEEVGLQYDNEELFQVTDFTIGEYYQLRVNAVAKDGSESPWAYQALDPFDAGNLPDIDTDGSFTLSHINSSNGGHFFTWTIGEEYQNYVNVIQIWAQPDSPLSDDENEGSNPPENGYYLLWEGDLGAEYKTLVFHAVRNWRVRANVKTSLGVVGTSYVYDEVTADEIRPPIPVGFKLVTEGGAQSRVGQKRFAWEMPSDVHPAWPRGYVEDIKTFRIRYISGFVADWDNAMEVDSTGINGDTRWYDTSLFDKGVWTVMIKAVDVTDWESESFAYFTIGIGDPLPTNIVDEVELQPDFTGELDNFKRENGKLIQTDATRESCYIYTYENPADNSQLLLDVDTSGTYQWWVRELGSLRKDYLIEDKAQYVVAEEQGTEKKIEVRRPATSRRMLPTLRTTDARSIDSNADPIWAKYAPNQLLEAGTYQFKLCIISKNGFSPAVVNSAKIVVDYPDVLHQVVDQEISASGTTILLPVGKFIEVKAVAISLRDDPDEPGDAISAKVIEKTSRQIKVETYDVDGNKVGGIVDLSIVGY